MNESDPSGQLNRLIAEEWQLRLAEDPLLATQTGIDRYNDRMPEVSPAAEARRYAQGSGFVQRLQAIDPDNLSAQDRLNFIMFTGELEVRAQQYSFGAHLMPLAKLSGPHSILPEIILLTPFRRTADYSAYLQRLGQFPQYIAGTIQLMEAGIQRGLVQAQAALLGIQDALRSLLPEDAAESVFFAPFHAFPSGILPAEQDRLRLEGSEIVQNAVLPAFKNLLEYVEKIYLPAARDAIGISAIPQGGEYYAFLVRKFTTLPVTPQQVYEIGLSEVGRIRAEMEELIRKIGFNGSFQEFIQFLRTDPRFYLARPADLMKEVALIMKRMDGELPRLFKVLPRTPYGLRQTPEHIAPRSTSAYYFPATGDGSTAGYYYVNTYDLPSRPLFEYEALSFHEAVPGHHLQLALQQEVPDVPDFRRYSQIDAFIEGWALYAERLGLEVGFYTDPYSDFGRLIYEMWRACRLVVDPGMHCLGWTRQQAIDFMAANTALSLLNIENEIDRYIAWPGQALAYKMGELKIRELRGLAEKRLGPRFDLREFHRVVLEDGAIPLDLLEGKVKRWINQSQ
jgi:uncharacterized protein (DUF885 family)